MTSTTRNPAALCRPRTKPSKPSYWDICGRILNFNEDAHSRHTSGRRVPALICLGARTLVATSCGEVFPTGLKVKLSTATYFGLNQWFAVSADEASSSTTQTERGLAFGWSHMFFSGRRRLIYFRAVAYQSDLSHGFQFIQQKWADSIRYVAPIALVPPLSSCLDSFVHAGVGFDPIIGMFPHSSENSTRLLSYIPSRCKQRQLSLGHRPRSHQSQRHHHACYWYVHLPGSDQSLTESA